MTIASRTNVALTSPNFGTPRAVPKLPVAGYTHRWNLKTLRQPTGSAINKIPNLIGTADAGALGDPIAYYPTLGSKQSQPVLQPVTGTGATGKRSRYVLPASIPQPYTMVAVGGTATADQLGLLVCSVNAYPNANTSRCRLGTGTLSTVMRWEYDAGVTLWHPGMPVDANMHVFVIVANGASSVISIDGNEVTGDAGTNAWFVNGHIGEIPGSNTATPGNTYAGNFLDHALYPRALTVSERAKLSSALLAQYGL